MAKAPAMRLLIASLLIPAFMVGMTAIGLQFTRHETADRTPQGPRIEVGREFDLGTVPKTQVVERYATFRNTGVEPLQVSILKVRPAPDAACGCGVEGFQVQPDSVPPGATGRLIFRLKVPEGMPQMEDKMVVELQTNDPARPTMDIAITFWMGQE